MGRKLRHLLIFLLIVLKEPTIPEAACSCAPSSPCKCSNLGLTSIPQNLPTSISKLHLKFNQITSIRPGAFAYLPRLQTLDLSDNEITMVQAGAFANLTQLDFLSLTANRITEIQAGIFENLPQLELLGLSQNQITKIQPGSFANLIHLKVLTLKNNKIAEIQPGTFANIPRLQNLFLANNQISKFQAGTFADLPKLETLKLYQNQITTIHSGLFANVPRLQELDLHHNQITMIHPGAFSNLPHLYLLDLRSNKMSAITPSAYGLSARILIIKLGGNPWQCDCRMAPFRLDTTKFPTFKNEIVCAKPAQSRGQKLVDVNFEGLICDETTISTLPVDIQTSLPSSAVPTSSFGLAESTDGPTIHLATQKALLVQQLTRPAVPTSSFGTTESTDGPTTRPAVPTSSFGHTESTDGPTARPAVSASSFGHTESTARPTTRPVRSTSATQPFYSPFESSNNCYNDTSRYHWYFRRNAGSTEDHAGKTSQLKATLTSLLVLTSGNPEISSSHEDVPSFPIPVLIASVCGSVAGIVLVGTTILTIWYKRRKRQSSLRVNPNVAGGNTNSGHDHQHEDIDNHHDQTGQDQSQAMTEAKTATVVTSGHGQTGQGQSHATAEPLDVRNLSYGTESTASQLNALYANVETQ